MPDKRPGQHLSIGSTIMFFIPSGDLTINHNLSRKEHLSYSHTLPHHIWCTRTLTFPIGLHMQQSPVGSPPKASALLSASAPDLSATLYHTFKAKLQLVDLAGSECVGKYMCNTHNSHTHNHTYTLKILRTHTTHTHIITHTLKI